MQGQSFRFAVEVGGRDAVACCGVGNCEVDERSRAGAVEVGGQAGECVDELDDGAGIAELAQRVSAPSVQVGAAEEGNIKRGQRYEEVLVNVVTPIKGTAPSCLGYDGFACSGLLM